MIFQIRDREASQALIAWTEEVSGDVVREARHRIGEIQASEEFRGATSFTHMASLTQEERGHLMAGVEAEKLAWNMRRVPEDISIWLEQSDLDILQELHAHSCAMGFEHDPYDLMLPDTDTDPSPAP